MDDTSAMMRACRSKWGSAMTDLGSLLSRVERIADVVLSERLFFRLKEQSASRSGTSSKILLTFLAIVFLMILGASAYVFVAYLTSVLA
jgi:hypothetical protein